MIEIEALRGVHLFAGLNDGHLQVLQKNLRPLHLEAGQDLVSEGVTTRGPLMIVTGGSLQVTRKDAEGTARTLATIEPPTVIGEMEFLADIEASATVTAHDEITGFTLPRARFDALLDADEPAAFHLARTIGRLMSERLAETNKMLTKALSKDPERMVRVQKAAMSHDLAAVDKELDDLLNL